MNITAFEYEDSIVVVGTADLLFEDDMSNRSCNSGYYLPEKERRIFQGGKGICDHPWSRGDHIGALPYVLK